MKILLLGYLALALVVPGVCDAQSVTWTAAPGVYVEDDSGGGNQLGPAVVLGATVPAGGPLAFTFDPMLARTDFPVGPEELHRNIGAASVTVNVMAGGERASVGATFGVGVLAWDDISETDPGFRSGADAEQIFAAGLEARFAVGGSWGITAFARDMVSGLVNRILDPSEGGLEHRFVLGAGVYFR